MKFSQKNITNSNMQSVYLSHASNMMNMDPSPPIPRCFPASSVSFRTPGIVYCHVLLCDAFACPVIYCVPLRYFLPGRPRDYG